MDFTAHKQPKCYNRNPIKAKKIHGNDAEDVDAADAAQKTHQKDDDFDPKTNQTKPNSTQLNMFRVFGISSGHWR